MYQVEHASPYTAYTFGPFHSVADAECACAILYRAWGLRFNQDDSGVLKTTVYGDAVVTLTLLETGIAHAS